MTTAADKLPKFEAELDQFVAANRKLVSERDNLLDAIRRLYGILGFDKSICRSCGAEIWWCKTKADKRMPLTPDAVSHFATCPDAAKHRRKR